MAIELEIRDQDIVNIAQDGEPYTQLSPEWGAWYKDGKYINHYGGIKRKDIWAMRATKQHLG